MLDFGWPELLVIIAVAVLVIGPDEIPEIMRTLGRLVRRLQYVRFALSRQFDDFMQQHDIDEMRGKPLDDDPDRPVPPTDAEKDHDHGA